MILNVIIGFIIPWIIALIIVRDRKLLYYVAPFASALSFLLNTAGYFLFWSLYPFHLGSRSAIPFNVGLFALAPCVLIQIMKDYKVRSYIGIGIMSLVLTLADTCGVLIGRVVYHNHWNIVATFFASYISLQIIYKFYKVLVDNRVKT